MRRILFREVEVDGAVVSVRVADGFVRAMGSGLEATVDEEVIDGDGAALLPGLHDHHLHLAAMAAADRSSEVSGDLDAVLAARHASAEPGEWIRAVGYDDAIAGQLDRHRLDALAPGRPVRVQHRSGAMWVLSSAALAAVGGLGNAHDELPDGVERDESGEPTGRVFRADDWLADRLPRQQPPDLHTVARRLAGYGVTGVTDATPSSSLDQLRLLAAPGLAVSVVATGGPALADADFPPPLGRGPVKLIVADHQPPGLDDLVSAIALAHRAGRPVAVHCVTRVGLALAVAAWDVAGVRSGDRVEHGAVVPPDLLVRLVELALTVVTQPAFIRARGDRYLVDVDVEDRPFLYPCASLLNAGVPVGGSTDAPFGPEDPWLAIAAAADRCTATGVVLGARERVTPRRALDLFLADPSSPGGPPRRVTPGAPADLCLLDRPLGTALDEPDRVRVRGVFRAGHG